MEPRFQLCSPALSTPAFSNSPNTWNRSPPPPAVMVHVSGTEQKVPPKMERAGSEVRTVKCSTCRLPSEQGASLSRSQVPYLPPGTTQHFQAQKQIHPSVIHACLSNRPSETAAQFSTAQMGCQEQRKSPQVAPLEPPVAPEPPGAVPEPLPRTWRYLWQSARWGS